MGVDYYQCAKCDIGFRDDSDYCVWCDCGNCFCSKECSKLLNGGEWVENEDGESFVKDNLDEPTTCVICRNESYTDYTLLESVLNHFKITREQAINIWKASKNGR